MGNGVSIVETEEFDGQLRGRSVRVSNNAPWYQKYYKENKKAPSKRELRDIAYDIYTGKNEYGLLGWENNSAEENQWYQNNKASIEATEEAIRRLDALTPMLEKIDPGELSITEGLSEEGFEVYRKLRGQLEGAESKQVRQAAQMSAIIAARMADRMAELHKQAGQRKYTAVDYARSIGLVRDGEVGGGLKQRGTVHIGTELTVQRPVEEVVRAYNTLINQSPAEFTQKIDGTDFKYRKDSASKIFNNLYKNEQGRPITVNNKYGDEIEVPRTAFKEISGHAKKDNLLELTPYIGELIQTAKYLYTRLPDASREKRMSDHVLEYRTYARKIKINGIEYYAKIVVRKEKSKKLKLHDVDITEIKNETSDSRNGGAEYSSASKPDKLVSVKNSIPWWLNEVKTKLLDDERIYDQKAWHGTPYNFERFDIGKIGAGVGDQVHGWSLYFAKNKKVSDNYKKVLSEGGNTEASLFKVEVPDNKYLLDEQKPFREQLKGVQRHIVEAMESLENEQPKCFWVESLNLSLMLSINRSRSREGAWIEIDYQKGGLTNGI